MLALRLRAAASALVLAICVASGCGDDEPAYEVEGLYTVPDSLDSLSGETFFDHPFPSDLRLQDGHVRMLGWPNPRAVPLLDEYIQFVDGMLDGFSPVAAGFMRFSGPLDPASLPDAEGSLDPAASVQLIDVDPDSPELGSRHPIYVTFRAEPGVYWQANTLSFMPVPGYPLRTRTTYALVVTSAVQGADGKTVGAPRALREVLGVEPASTSATEAARSSVAGSVAALAAAGVPAESIVQFTTFTTDDPTEEFMATAGALPQQVEAPTADPSAWELREDDPNYDEYNGTYGPTPNYQVGETPYVHFGDGGGFEVDEEGVAQVQNLFNLRFSLSVPNAEDCPMPENGYPIVLYAHGTTGDFRSYVYDGTAKSLTGQCLAVMGVDQIFHGDYPGAPDNDTSIQILFFNFNNIEAARTNIRQSGLDEVQRARLFTESHMTVPASVSLTGSDIKFDASKLMFFGHSQGSLNGPLFLAGSDAGRGGVLSGASAIMQITLLEKTRPEPSVANLVKTIFLQLLLEEQEEVSLLYPPIALAQSIVDPVDPGNYARFLIQEPRYGEPKSVYMTEGVGPDGTGDSYAPPRGCEALAMAMGLPFQTPLVHEPIDVVGELSTLSVPADGMSGNLAGGKASGVLAQWQPSGGDGHFVVFDVPEATNQAAHFLRNLADDPAGSVPPP